MYLGCRQELRPDCRFHTCPRLESNIHAVPARNLAIYNAYLCKVANSVYHSWGLMLGGSSPNMQEKHIYIYIYI